MTNPDEKILIETTEKIVIDYANLSGRESANRAVFRNATHRNLEIFIATARKEERERTLEEAIKQIRVHDSPHENGNCTYCRVQSLKSTPLHTN